MPAHGQPNFARVLSNEYLSMERGVPGVKRSYDASRRRARADQVSRSLVDAARTMLLSEGYAATTIPKVARACGVAVDSVYKRFPGRAALVRAVVDDALRGVGQVSAEVRSDALTPDDLTSLIRGWGRLTAEVAPRVAPVLLLVRAAAAVDADVVPLAQQLDDERRSRMRDNAQRLRDAGHLPGHMSIEQMADVLWTYSAPELYDLLVQRRGWTIGRYGEFVTDGIAGHLSGSAEPDGAANLQP
jgi:AcrR family transcriptional regulator